MALILAAGSGQRLGRPTPKAFVPLVGRPMIAHSIAAAFASARVEAAVLVVPAGWERRARAAADLVAGRSAFGVTVTTGGATRQESVRLGMAAAPPAGVLVCHDAARPLATAALFDRVVEALDDGTFLGAVPVLPCVDTVKRVRDGRVVQTIPRTDIGLAQTPQAFVRAALAAAHERALERGLEATDDAMLLEVMDAPVRAVPGEPENEKVTTETDVRRAAAVLAERGIVTPEGVG